VVKKKQYSPWIWIPSLCVAEEIPAAVVMFVAVLMFLQFGADEGMAALYSGLLFLPWVMKSYLYSKVRKAGSFKRRLHWVELTMFVCLMGIAVYISEAKVRAWLLFVFLYVLSCLCAWHELLSRMYYARMLEPRKQRLYGNTKMVSSQMALVVTYGVLIIVAGFFEVFFRSYQKAWAMESSLVAGGFLVFCVLNLVVLPHLRVPQPYRYESVADTVKNEWHIVSRIRQKPHIFPILLSLFFLLLPQSLMFNPRVFFLLASSERGGLDCSFQDVGFAQGTIGVLAFSIGIALGRALMRRYGNRSMFGMTAVVLTLSPVPYMLMARQPQLDNMFLLCCMTFVAQLFFGFGLNVCRVYVPYISEQRYRNVTNFLYLPMVASLMVVPMAVSGWLCSELGYSTFFKLCVAIAPLAWVLLALCKTKKYLLMGVDK
jgi:PAT family beta-lactamase induction signal transducer AmpG